MARTEGSGWGAGNPTFQICPCCNRKTLYYHSKVFNGDNGFRCTYSRRGCTFSITQDISMLNLIRKRNF